MKFPNGRVALAARKLTSLSFVLLAVAFVAATIASANNGREQSSETTIERPANRAATAFVPRLGKRLDQQFNGILCADPVECKRLTLIGALIRDVANYQEPTSHSAALNYQQRPAALGGPSNEFMGMRDQFDLQLNNDYPATVLQQQQQQLRRDTRAPDVSLQAVGGELDGSAANYGVLSSKRVAFTPRIGRRR